MKKIILVALILLTSCSKKDETVTPDLWSGTYNLKTAIVSNPHQSGQVSFFKIYSETSMQFNSQGLNLFIDKPIPLSISGTTGTLSSTTAPPYWFFNGGTITKAGKVLNVNYSTTSYNSSGAVSSQAQYTLTYEKQ